MNSCFVLPKMFLWITEAFLLSLTLSSVLNFSFFQPVLFQCGTKLLLDLDEKKSCGIDGYPPKILENSAAAIATSLTKLFNETHYYHYLA